MSRYRSKRLAKEKRYKQTKLILLVLLFALIAVNFVIFIEYSKFSKIDHFTVTGLKKTESPEDFVKQMKAQVHNTGLVRLLGIDNYFAWREKFNYINPQYQDVRMKKRLKEGTINFFVELRERYAIWCKIEVETERENCRWIDKEGVSFESAPSTSGQIIPSIKEKVGLADFSANAQIANISIFKYIESILNAITKLEIQKDEVYLDRSLQELQISTVNGTKIIFSLRFDPKPAAIPALTRFSRDPGLNFFEEINLAVENRAFTKVR